MASAKKVIFSTSRNKHDLGKTFLVSASVLTTFLPDALAFSLLFEHRQKATLWAVLVPVVAT
jgi:hypothetical protein